MHGASRKQRSVGHDRERTSDVRDGYDRPRGEGSLKGFKHVLLEGGPGPRLVFPGEKVEWGNDVGEVGDKLAIKVHKPEKRVNTFDRSRGFPFFNGRKLDRIHFDLSLTNNHAEEFNARYSGSKKCPNVCMFFTKVDNP